MLSQTLQQRLTTLHPEGSSALTRLSELAPASTDPALLDLCGSMVDALLDNRTWQPPHALTPREQAFTAFTEQFVTAVSGTTDQQVQRLLEFASDDEVYNFVNALYVVDMTRRLERVAGRLLT